MIAAVTTRHVGEGVYQLPDGAQVRWAWKQNRAGDPVRHGWQLIEADGAWATTRWTKAEAIEAWAASR
jgi:hypothetical protein